MNLRLGLLTVLFLTAPVVAADPPTPFPQFTGERLYVADVPDVYDSVRTAIAYVERTSRQTYYVAVVRTSGSGSQATRTYTDALYQTWLRQAAEQKLRLDPDRSVLVVLALDNRQLSIHPGHRLVTDYDLTAKKIDTEIVGPNFIPFAKAGNYPQGLVTLIPKFEGWVVAHEAALARKQEEAVSPKPQVSNAAAAVPASAPPGNAVALQAPVEKQPVDKQLAESPKPVVENATPAAPVQQAIDAPRDARLLAQTNAEHATHEAQQGHIGDSHSSPAPQATGGFPVALSVGGGLVAIALLVVGAMRGFHLRRKRLAGEQLAEFKQRVVQLSDSLDALRERHKLLPFAVADFKEPMTGETLALYNAAQEALVRYREEWLKLMEAWERAEKSIQAAQPLSTKHYKEAQRILTAAGVADALQGVTEQCSTPLDRLEKAHAQAASALSGIEAETVRLNKQIEAVQAAGLAIGAYQADREASAALVARAPALLRADPIGAQNVLDQARKKIAEVFRRAERILEQAQAARNAEQESRRVADLVAQRRAAGLLLREEGANPDPLLAGGREHHQAALEKLNAGDADAAQAHLQQVSSLADRAVRTIDAHVKAKAGCEKEIPARQAEMQRLHAIAQQAHACQLRLEQEFAPDSWRGVGTNLKEGGDLLGNLAPLIENAKHASSIGVQHYLAAASLLERVEKEQKQTAVLFEGIGQRFKELSELRTQCQSKLAEGRSHAGRVGELLRTHTADRPRSNQRYQAACQSLEQVAREAAAPRPEWTKLSGRLGEVLADLAKAEQFAREDIQLAQQADAEIAETEQVIRQARAYSSMGFTADVSAAVSLLAQARSSLQSQAYEEVIQLANRAEQAARSAHDDAVRRAEAKQAQLDEEHRQREAAARAQALAAAAAVAAVAVPVVTAFASSSFGDGPPQHAPDPFPASGMMPNTSPIQAEAPLSETPASSGTSSSETSQSSW